MELIMFLKQMILILGVYATIAVKNQIVFTALAKQIQSEFGVVNYFRGDGITSFALPDLRNEFLRGYHEEAAEKLSGNIGEHQEATEIPYIWRGDTSDPSWCTFDPSRVLTQTNQDKFINGNSSKRGFIIRNLSTYSTEGTTFKYTTRPMNVAVLYCIKYKQIASFQERILPIREYLDSAER